MQALRFYAPEDVRLEEVPEPPEPAEVLGVVVAIEAICLPLVVPDVTPVTAALAPVCTQSGTLPSIRAHFLAR